MDTLPQDLINLISKHIRASDCFLLSIRTPDNQPYLNLITVKARLKLALKERNVGWIHQIVKYFEHSGVLDIDHRSIVWLLLKYNFKSMFDHLYSPKYEQFIYSPLSYDCYIDGKRGDDSKYNTYDPSTYTNMFIKGLSKGQHHDLFDRYATTSSLISSYIMNFKDEEYIISKIKDLVKSCHYHVQLFNESLKIKKFKVAQYLLDHHKNNISTVDSCLGAYLIHTKQYRDKYYKWTVSLKFSIYQACIDSNFEALDHIYNSLDDNHDVRHFKNILSWCLITKELYQYACKKFDFKVVLDIKLINVLDQLKDRINKYKYFYNHIDAIEHSDDVFEFIIISLLNHYISKNDMIEFKLVYKIVIEFDILCGEKVFKVINQLNIWDDTMFLVANNLYQKMEPRKLREKAREAGIENYNKMKKSELIFALLDGSC